jgi:hypothetical protein
MNNIFLLSEAINTSSVEALEQGIFNLNAAVNLRKSERDVLMLGEDFWYFQTIHGQIHEFAYSIVKDELRIIVIKLFGSFKSSPIYFANEADFDVIYPNDCNGFMGIDFTGTTVSEKKQITGVDSFSTFVTDCFTKQAYTTTQEFWNKRAEIFPKLVFCERVWDQIKHLSVDDDRMKLINDKLVTLNRFTDTWNQGSFNYKNLGLDNSPDTPKRVKDTLALRTFTCPKIGNKIFNFHIKWSFGGVRWFILDGQLNKRII